MLRKRPQDIRQTSAKTTTSGQNFTSSTRRKKISMQVFTTVIESHFVRFLALFLIVAGSFMFNLPRSLCALFLCSFVVFSYVFRKYLAFECVLMMEICLHWFGAFEWYSVVDDNLLLGAIPLMNMHAEEFQRMNVSLIVSVVEPFELQTATLFDQPVPQEYWKKIGIEQRVLSTPDFFPPTLEVLEEGSKLLDEYLREGKRVYVHCKSGRGRSASVVLAYFCRYRYTGMDLHSIHSKLRSRRPAVFGDPSPQMRKMSEFLQRIRPISGI